MANDLIDYVEVLITEDTIGLARQGFGVPLIMAPDAPFPERTRVYRSLPAYEADGAVVNGVSWLALRAMLSQNPHPSQVIIGRMENLPTMIYTLTPVAKDNHLYQLRVRGPGFANTLLQFTSGVSATPTTISTGLIAALNGVVGKNFTATGTATTVVTGNAAGNWFSVEVIDRNDFTAVQNYNDAGSGGIAADASAIMAENADFYGIYNPFLSQDIVINLADWTEANGRLYIAETMDTAVVRTAPGGADVAAEAMDNAYARTSVWFHPSPAEMLTASLMGRVLPLEAGSETWLGKQLAGTAKVKLTTTERNNLAGFEGAGGKHANSYELKGQRGVTFNGQTADGDFIDIQRGQDWVTDEMSKAIAEVIFGAPTKVLLTDKGIARVQGAMEGTMRRAVNREIAAEEIGPPASPTTSVPRALDIPPDVRANRRLPDLLATYRQQGAIHKAHVRITVSV